ncbi:threonine/serine exporter family protein [Kitasatospora sp. NPDC015120]|uniref:threonine/serine ThrE exporter family protein n=1 Tax=Kitasatospora sp. NPDC015120 TaxID=3364023 RepID=UPI0036F4A817
MPEHEQLGPRAEPGGPAEAPEDPGPAELPARPDKVPLQTRAPRPPADLDGPAVTGVGATSWPDRMLPLLRTPTAARPLLPEPLGAHRPGPAEVAAVLDLALLVGELLLASGEAAEDVEVAMLAVARAYGVHPCDPQVTFTRVAVSYRPGPAEPSLTAERSVRRPAGDYARLALLFRLVTRISAGGIDVEQAHRRLAAGLRTGHRYPGWLVALSCGLLAGAATVLVGGRTDARAGLVFTSAFVAASVGDRLAALVARHDLPEFYQFVLAATPAALIGILLSFNGLHLRGSAVITGGLYALLPGWRLVAAAQEGLAGFYLTAAARMLEALFLMAGVVIGVTAVLYVGINHGADLAARDLPVGASNPPVQLTAAVLVALAFAVMLNTEPGALPAVMLNGTAGWTTYGVLVGAGQQPIAAAALAAGLVGLAGQVMARHRGSPALPHVTAALGPLLPGSLLYFALLAFVRGDAEAGLRGMAQASAMAMALAIGVNLGREAARLLLPARTRTPARTPSPTRTGAPGRTGTAARSAARAPVRALLPPPPLRPRGRRGRHRR